MSEDEKFAWSAGVHILRSRSFVSPPCWSRERSLGEVEKGWLALYSQQKCCKPGVVGNTLIFGETSKRVHHRVFEAAS